jgi:hypothetical protein
MSNLAKPPLKEDNFSPAFQRWLAKVHELLAPVSSAGLILWANVSKVGSSLTDIVTRNHADLQNINTATYTHLSATNATDLTDGGSSSLHYHQSDRDYADSLVGIGGGTTTIFIRGEDGEDGQSSYAAGPAGQNGTNGSNGTNGLTTFILTGSDGEDGERGFPGAAGVNGSAGANGTNGLDGYTIRANDGEDGQDGIPGVSGTNGTNGTNGLNGIDGLTIRGQDGEDGDSGYILLQSTGGSSLIPATTVVSETSASQASAVGTSLNYAREDHTHGTPAAGASGNYTTIKNSADVAETLTITAGFQFICWNIFENRGDIVNRGDMVVL